MLRWFESDFQFHLMYATYVLITVTLKKFKQSEQPAFASIEINFAFRTILNFLLELALS